MIVVVTATYNRKDLLNRLYQSLSNQKYNNFLWLIIDDGSTDSTGAEIAKWQENAGFEIQYCYKDNGGKHSALNFAFDLIPKNSWVFFVDSDDFLVENAIYNLNLELSKLEEERILIVHKMYPNGEFMANLMPEGIHKFENFRKTNSSGDKSEIYHSELIKDFRFPIFTNEKFIAESPMHLALSEGQTVKCVNKAFTICEYLEGGLTASSLNNRKASINSTLYVYQTQYNYYRRNKLYIHSIKAAANWWRFYFYSGFKAKRNVPIIYSALGFLMYSSDYFK